MKILFTCKRCKLTKQPVEVVARGQNEPLSRWMKYVQRMVGATHEQISPQCHSTHCDLYIPHSSSGRVGSE